jgi:hypothetical protein
MGARKRTNFLPPASAVTITNTRTGEITTEPPYRLNYRIAGAGKPIGGGPISSAHPTPTRERLERPQLHKCAHRQPCNHPPCAAKRSRP